MDDKFKKIRSAFYQDIKLADIKYTLACAEIRLDPKECIYKGIDTYLEAAIADGFAYDVSTKLDDNVDPETFFTKETFLKICADTYDKKRSASLELAKMAQMVVAESESKQAVKN